MSDDVTVTIAPWSEDDFWLLERGNTAEMTRHLGGPESAEQLVARHERYLRGGSSGDAEMFRIEVNGVPGGGIGFWPVDHDGRPAYETGWNVLPEWQGRGVAGEAVRLIVRRVVARGDRTPLVAFPGVDNPKSNALCRRAGFALVGEPRSQPWRGGELTFHVWELDMSPLELSGRTPDAVEEFESSSLDPTRWWPYYTPHWSSRERTKARWSAGPGGLALRIEESTPPWAPEWDGDIRVSHLQTGQFSGVAGSGVGQHRFREGLVVREPQPVQRLWLPRGGVIDVRMAAIRHPDAMVAFWPIGFEEHPDECGEICIAEIFGRDVDDDGSWVTVGVKAQNDPRLRTDVERIRVDGDLTQMHDYAVEWTPERLRFFIDGRWVKTVAQRIDYPVQLMLDVYELPPASSERDVAALPHAFRVERVRTFPPR